MDARLIIDKLLHGSYGGNPRFDLEERRLLEADLAALLQAARARSLEEAAQIAEGGMLDIGCTADEAVGIVRRTRDAIAAAIRKLSEV